MCDLKLRLRIQVFWDVMLCRCVSVSWCFEGSVFIWNFKQCRGPSILEVESTLVIWNVLKHYPSNTVSCLKGPGLSVTDALQVFHPLSRIPLFRLFSLVWIFFDWATNLQLRLHSTDVNKQLGRSDHVAQSQLWQAALHNIQIDCAT